MKEDEARGNEPSHGKAPPTSNGLPPNVGISPDYDSGGIHHPDTLGYVDPSVVGLEGGEGERGEVVVGAVVAGSSSTPPPGLVVVADSFESLVGTDGEEAAAIIQAREPGLTVVTIPEGSMVTMDHRMDRIRVWTDRETGKVKTVKRG